MWSKWLESFGGLESGIYFCGVWEAVAKGAGKERGSCLLGDIQVEGAGELWSGDILKTIQG